MMMKAFGTLMSKLSMMMEENLIFWEKKKKISVEKTSQNYCLFELMYLEVATSMCMSYVKHQQVECSRCITVERKLFYFKSRQKISLFFHLQRRQIDVLTLLSLVLLYPSVKFNWIIYFLCQRARLLPVSPLNLPGVCHNKLPRPSLLECDVSHHLHLRTIGAAATAHWRRRLKMIKK